MDKVEVTQVDRDAAKGILWATCREVIDQAFARHRMAAMPAEADMSNKSIASLDKIQDYRFGSMVKGENYAFARGLTINPTHLPSALDAMEKDGWDLLAIFGQTTAEEIGFIFKRRT